MGSSSEELDELKRFTVAMLQAYNDASKRLTGEAELLIATGIAMREQAMAMLERANQLAYEYAKVKDAADKAALERVGYGGTEDDIDF